jgi:chloramphenicol 3-O-phosphotransferase
MQSDTNESSVMATDNLSASVVLVTGAMAAGKSSVAQRLAERMDPSVHLRGDVFRRMIVNGRKDVGSEPDAEAMRQLLLRYRSASETARIYNNAGFNVIYQDVVVGPVINEVVPMYKDLPFYVVVLCPNVETIVRREKERSKTGYGSVTVEQLQTALASTPRIGLWVDSSDQTIAETTAVILEKFDQAKVISE